LEFCNDLFGSLAFYVACTQYEPFCSSDQLYTVGPVPLNPFSLDRFRASSSGGLSQSASLRIRISSLLLGFMVRPQPPLPEFLSFSPTRGFPLIVMLPAPSFWGDRWPSTPAKMSFRFPSSFLPKSPVLHFPYHFTELTLTVGTISSPCHVFQFRDLPYLKSDKNPSLLFRFIFLFSLRSIPLTPTQIWFEKSKLNASAFGS